MRFSDVALLAFLAACGGSTGPLFVGADAGPAPAPTTARLIQYGGRVPAGAAALRALVARIDQVDSSPFDGLVLDLGTPGIWNGLPINPASYAEAVGVLRDAPSAKLRESFHRMFTTKAIDWTDDATVAAVARNAGTIAALAREARLRGLFVDPQTYGPNAWHVQPGHAALPFAELEAAVGRGGEAIMNAMLDAWPDVVVMLTFGQSEPLRATCVFGESIEAGRYAVWAAFVAGMERARVARGRSATLVDGFLPSYPTRDPGHFPLYRALVAADFAAMAERWRPGVVTFAAPAASGETGESAWPATPTIRCDAAQRARFGSNLAAGFGVMLDYAHDRTGPFQTDPAAFGSNHLTPDAFRDVVRAALTASDGWVWIWTSSLDWWPAPDAMALPKVPATYSDALRAARGRP